MGLRDGAYAGGLALLGVLLAVALLLPFRSEILVRADGVEVPVPSLDRLQHTSDTWDYLQLGRALWEGDGFTSRFTYVPFLPESVQGERGETEDLRFPLLWRQPGFPLLVAAAFGIRGTPHPDAVLFLQGLAIVLLPLAVFLLARSVLPPGWAALTALWSLLSPVALGVPGPPVATTWFVVFLTLLTAFVLAAKAPWAWIVAGLFLGGLVLFRLETWVLVPGLLVLFLLARGTEGRRAWVGVVILVVVGMLVTVPWHLRLAQITGDAFYNASSLLYHDVGPFPGWAASRSLAVRDMQPWTFLSTHGSEVGEKTLVNLARYVRDLVLLPSPLLPPLALLALLRPPREPRARGLLFGGAAMLVCLTLFLAPLQYAGRFLAVLVPFLAVGAGLTLIRIPRYRRSLAVLATLLGVVTLARAWTERSAEDAGAARVAAGDLARLVARPEAAPLRAGAVALTDAPTIYAWIWNRPAVWAPVSEDVTRVREMLPASVGLFTCARKTNDPLEGDLLGRYVEEGGRLVLPAGCPQLVIWPPGGTPDGGGATP